MKAWKRVKANDQQALRWEEVPKNLKILKICYQGKKLYLN
jgi:hypothetical protein